MTEPIASLLPDDFLESLSLLPENQAVTLLTRHSIREQADNYNAHHSLPLTPEGIELAAYWGALQPFEEFQLFSSPVARCIDTARHMHRGKLSVHEDVDVEIVSSLTEPGCFINNREVMQTVGAVFLEEGPITFLNHIISGEFKHLISTRKSIAGLLKQFKSSHNNHPHSLNVHVSHDTVLGAFVYSLLGKTSLNEDDWPRMMEGVYLWFDDRKVYGVWRGEHFQVALSHFNDEA